MKYVLMIFLCAACAAAGGLGTTFFVDQKFTAEFKEKTGITYQEFDEAYAQCVVASGELCNLFGGFAPLSKFQDR